MPTPATRQRAPSQPQVQVQSGSISGIERPGARRL
jgi:hypothetical protein